MTQSKLDTHTALRPWGVKLKLQVSECTQHKTDLRFVSSKHPVAIVEVTVPSAVPSPPPPTASPASPRPCVLPLPFGGLVRRRVCSKSAAPLAFLFHSYQMEKSSSKSCCPVAAVAHTDACIDFSSQPASKSFVVPPCLSSVKYN
jgi:hypothetical protein